MSCKLPFSLQKFLNENVYVNYDFLRKCMSIGLGCQVVQTFVPSSGCIWT